MASITTRNLGDEVKTRLRVRAADNGRSVEEEARLMMTPEAIRELRLRTTGTCTG